MPEMHPFPPTEDLQFLLKGDAVLDHITVFRFMIAFGFENDCVVQSEHEITYVRPDGVETFYGEPWSAEAPITFHALLGKQLVAVAADDVLLTLTFEGGETLLVHSVLGPYEAGQITSPATPLIVF